MKNYKKVHKSYDTDVLDSVICDICKREYGPNWNRRSSYTVLETEIRLKTGTSHPEGGLGEETTFDICPECFTDRLIPTLRKLGAEPTVLGWDW